MSLPIVRYSEADLELYFAYKSMEERYRVEWVDRAPNGAIPGKYFVKGVPWISHSILLCINVLTDHPQSLKRLQRFMKGYLVYGINASEVKTIHELLLEAASLEEEAGRLMINAGRAMVG